MGREKKSLARGRLLTGRGGRQMPDEEGSESTGVGGTLKIEINGFDMWEQIGCELDHHLQTLHRSERVKVSAACAAEIFLHDAAHLIAHLRLTVSRNVMLPGLLAVHNGIG